MKKLLFFRRTSLQGLLLFFSGVAHAGPKPPLGVGCEGDVCQFFVTHQQQIVSPSPEVTSGVPVYNSETGSTVILCQKTAEGPRELYDGVMQMVHTMFSFSEATNRVSSVATEAQQTMLLFYSTLLSQAGALSCSVF